MCKALERDERLFQAGWNAREAAFKKQIAEEDVQVIFSDAVKLNGIKVEGSEELKCMIKEDLWSLLRYILHVGYNKGYKERL
jgi:hypothetical protein